MLVRRRDRAIRLAYLRISRGALASMLLSERFEAGVFNCWGVRLGDLKNSAPASSDVIANKERSPKVIEWISHPLILDYAGSCGFEGNRKDMVLRH